MRIRVLLASFALVGVSCDCLDFSAGTIKVETNCAATPTSASVAFVKAPGGITQSQIQGYFPAELGALAGDIACDQLLNPKSFGDLCAPLGVGGPLGQQIDLNNLGDLRVLMCGGQMFAIGGSGDGLFLCKADQAVIDGQIWYLSCQRFAADPNKPTGECQGVAEFDAQTGL